MIVGLVKIENGAVVTHRDSYAIENLSVVSVRRPYLAPAILGFVGATGFVLAFSDLMFSSEIYTTLAAGVAGLITGLQVGQLSLLSRDLKGTELSSAIWGRHKHLQTLRAKIMNAIHTAKFGDSDA